MGAEAVITAYGITLAPVISFYNLGRILSTADSDCTSVVSNLLIAKHKWARLTRVLIREGTDARNSGQIYLAVFQSVMMYSLETWVMTPHIGRVLGGFHHRVALRITEKQPWRGRNGV